MEESSTTLGAIGELFRARRQELELRAEDVASRSGLSIRTIYRVEMGASVSLGNLEKVATALEIPLTDLLAKKAS